MSTVDSMLFLSIDIFLEPEYLALKWNSLELCLRTLVGVVKAVKATSSTKSFLVSTLPYSNDIAKPKASLIDPSIIAWDLLLEFGSFLCLALGKGEEWWANWPTVYQHGLSWYLFFRAASLIDEPSVLGFASSQAVSLRGRYGTRLPIRKCQFAEVKRQCLENPSHLRITEKSYWAAARPKHFACFVQSPIILIPSALRKGWILSSLSLSWHRHSLSTVLGAPWHWEPSTCTHIRFVPAS